MGRLTYEYSENGNWEEAEKLDRTVYEKRRRVLRENDKDSITSLNNLAYDLNELGRYKEALEYFRTVYEWRKEKIGPDDEQTIIKQRIDELKEKLSK